MRTPPNDSVSERTCVLTRAKGDRARLVRLALSPAGDVLPDVRARAPGRGAWIAVDRPALDTAVAKGKLKGALSRAFKEGDVSVPEDLGARIETALADDALNRLGLEARASTLVTGSERINEAARNGKVALLLHAADAAEDGNRRLDQAWRVGNDDEGARGRIVPRTILEPAGQVQPRAGARGLVLSAPRAILSAALGRDNVVHIGVTDARAADRVALAIDRWHAFIGLPTTGWLAENTAKRQGRAAHEENPDFGQKGFG